MSPKPDIVIVVICPLQARFDAVLKDTQELNISLRKLKRAMRQCSECPEEGQCQALANFNAQFAIAVQEVTEEWGITAY
jgi:hypothetical protein